VYDGAVDSLTARAEALRAAGRYEEAVGFAEQALALDPENFTAHAQRASALHMADRDLEALVAAEKCCEMQPENGSTHRVRASILSHLAKHREAVEAANLAVSIDPDVPMAQFVLAKVLVGAGRDQEALGHIAVAKTLDPEFANPHELEGNIYLEQENFAAAESAFRAALELDPEMAVAKYNLAIVLRRTGRADQAVALTRTLIVDDPSDLSNVQAMINAGNEYVRGGPLNKAMVWCLRLSFLRLPLIPAMILAPFAYIERKRRKASLPAGSWEAIQAAKQSRPILEAKRVDRNKSLKNVAIIITLMVLVVGGLLLLLELLGSSPQSSPITLASHYFK
jgi:tetratricopeptide (TPR) repeat protein